MEDDLQLARRAALAGAEVGLGYFAAVVGLRRELKVDGSVVTAADRAVEATIREVLTAARPGDAILGEEGGQISGTADDGGQSDGSARRRWIIDPIDGTALFVEGDDRWLVLLALEEDGEIVVGVAVVPAKGRIWWAAKGAGAFEGTTGDLDAAWRIRVAADDGAEHGLSVVPALIDPVTGENTVPYKPEVVAGLPPALPWDLHPPLLVARGDRDLAVQTSGQVWDFAATSLIVTEAGGVYSGLAGSSRPAVGPSLFARSARVRDDTMRVLGG
jgi:histidinol-phosphatase